MAFKPANSTFVDRSPFSRAFIDPAIVLFMFMLSFVVVILCGLFEWKRICAGFLSFVYICIAVLDPAIKRGNWVPINRFNLAPHRFPPVPI